MSERKINLEEIIKEELYNKHLYFNKINTVQIKNICLEFGKQLLELAAENADVKAISEMISIPNGADFNIQKMVVNKQSILDTIKQVK